MATPPHAKRPRAAWVRPLLAGCLLLMVLGAMRLFYPPDDPAPDTSALVHQPLQLAPGQNAYAILAQAAPLLRQDFVDEQYGKVREMVDGSSWDAAQARLWLAGMEAIWPLWDRAALAPHSQMPWGGPTAVDPNWERILALADLALIRARSMTDDGRVDDALKSLLTNLRVICLIEETRSNLAVSLADYGSERKIQALKALRGIASKNGATAPVLRQVLEGLEGLRPSRASAVFSIQQTYLRLEGIFEAMRQFTVFQRYVSLSDPPGPAPFYQRIGLQLPLTFKPNRTRRLFIDGIQGAIGAIDLDFNRLSALNRAWRETNSAYPIPWARFRLDNLFGQIAGNYVNPYDPLGDRLKEQSTLSASEAFLALLLCHRDHGEMPATLDALVPAYLPAVPRDYFDGRPIKYSRDFRAVWSVGSDNFYVNHAGLDQAKLRDEIYLPLDFAAPPPAAASGSAGGSPAP